MEGLEEVKGNWWVSKKKGDERYRWSSHEVIWTRRDGSESSERRKTSRGWSWWTR